MFWKEESTTLRPAHRSRRSSRECSGFSRRARAIGHSNVFFSKTNNQCEDAKKKEEDREVGFISANPELSKMSGSDLIMCGGQEEKPKSSTYIFPSTGRTIAVLFVGFGGFYNK
jgi:hypothetical protein